MCVKVRIRQEGVGAAVVKALAFIWANGKGHKGHQRNARGHGLPGLPFFPALSLYLHFSAKQRSGRMLMSSEWGALNDGDLQVSPSAPHCF